MGEGREEEEEKRIKTSIPIAATNIAFAKRFHSSTQRVPGCGFGCVSVSVWWWWWTVSEPAGFLAFSLQPCLQPAAAEPGWSRPQAPQILRSTSLSTTAPARPPACRSFLSAPKNFGVRTSLSSKRPTARTSTHRIPPPRPRPKMRSLAAVVVAASWTVAGVAAQSYDPIQNFCRRFGHQGT